MANDFAPRPPGSNRINDEPPKNRDMMVWEGVLDQRRDALAPKYAGNYATWVCTDVGLCDNSLRSYLDLHIDGIIVNPSTVPTLISILNEPQYLAMYELATNGYNPWAPPPIPAYWGAVQTADVTWTGTDALVNPSLDGTNGSLVCSIHGGWAGVLEQGDSNDGAGRDKISVPSRA
jgi:hypothetical protein